MALASRGRAELVKHWKERETSPERTKVWTEPKPKPKPTDRKVPVVYYLSRNGQLEHPHFMEVPLSSAEGLYLRDVMSRLDFLRGKGMASLYSWSAKRSYKNGYVWHDLSEDDFIYPAHGLEYVLKGSELHSFSSSQEVSQPSSSSEKPLEISKSIQDDSEFPLVGGRKKKTAWSSLDLTEYKVYKTELSSEAATKAADASTQTDDKRHRNRAQIKEEQEEEEQPQRHECEDENPTTELGSDEISPPPSSSSPETLESLIKADGRLIMNQAAESGQDRTAGVYASGRMRASAVLMNLISCGSISVKDYGFSPVAAPPQRDGARVARGSEAAEEKQVATLAKKQSFPAVVLEEKEYFSGSLIETKKKAADFPSLKRSSSYNADRGSKLELAEKEVDGVRAKCIPRKPKTAGKRREENSAISRSSHGSKRINDEPAALISEPTPNSES